jgi:hypothetical protein
MVVMAHSVDGAERARLIDAELGFEHLASLYKPLRPLDEHAHFRSRYRIRFGKYKISRRGKKMELDKYVDLAALVAGIPTRFSWWR